MADLSRTTLNLLENGALSDLEISKVMRLMALLGLQLLASKTASVSYLGILTPKELVTALATGCIPANRIAHVATLLDEAPVSLLASTVEETTLETRVPAKKIGKHITTWAHDFHSPRQAWA